MNNLLNKDSINKAAMSSIPSRKGKKRGIQKAKESKIYKKNWKKHRKSFTLGANWAEDQIVELSVEFMKWYSISIDSKETVEELYNQFLKEKYEES